MRSAGDWSRSQRSVPSTTVELDDTLDVPVDLDTAWVFIQDTRKIAACIPGLDPESVVQESATRFRGVLKHVALGVPSRWDLTADVQRADAAHELGIQLDGAESRVGLTLSGSTRLVLSSVDQAHARLAYSGSIRVEGRLAGAGSPIIHRVIENIIQRFLVEVGSAGQRAPEGRWDRFVAWLRHLVAR